MTRAVIVTTTVNVPERLIEWLPGMTSEDEFIIVGDMKTNANALCNFMARHGARYTYIGPREQGRWSVSEFLGWNTIARRNVGTLEAITRHPEFIVMIDDDNYPVRPKTYLNEVHSYFYETCETRLFSSPSNFIDTVALVYPTATWRHRGFPPSLRTNDIDQVAEITPLSRKVRLGVFESHWVGHPDIDAVDRVTFNDTYAPDGDMLVVPARSMWAPFNSQATAYHIDLAPLMFVWPHIGRADDIFASYTARAVMDTLGWYVAHGAPYVYHDRDAYGERTFKSHLRDLKNEMFCYEHTDDIINILRDNAPEGWHPSANSYDVLSLLNYYFGVIKAYASFLPRQTLCAMDAWLEDVTRAAFGEVRS